MAEREHGAPPQIQPSGPSDYLEAMSRSVFQSGISWTVVDKKWPGTREAFGGFDARAVADFRPDDVDRIVADPRIIRNRRKVEGIVHNARTILELDREYGGFAAYLKSKPDYESLVRDMKKRFKFLGDSGAYIFLYVVGEPVPEYHAWREAHPPAAARQTSAR